MRYNKVSSVHHQHGTIGGGEFTQVDIEQSSGMRLSFAWEITNIDFASDDPGHMMHDAFHIPRPSDRVCYVRLYVAG